MVTLNLVTDIEQVKRNIIQYNKELHNGEMSLRTNGVQQWYYIMELDLFGPSRYIAYEDITIQKHKNASNLNGGETTNTLSKWFELCDDPELLEMITEKLVDSLSKIDMNIRQNKENQPSFKLNLLKEDIPKLKQLSLSEKIQATNMKCQTCGKSFWLEPFYAHNERGPYCSQKCLPDYVMNEFKAIEYVTYVEKYREFIESYNEIESVVEQNELLNELELIEISMEEYLGKEPESDYVLFIQQLNDKFIALQQDTYNYYKDETHLDMQKAFHINWTTFGDDEFIEEQLSHLIDYLHEQLKTVSVQYKLLDCTKLHVDFSTTNTVYFTSEDVSRKTDNVIDNIYAHFHDYLNDYDLSYDMSAYIQNSLVAVCPKCGSYELMDHFSKNDDNLFCCDHC